MKYIVELEKTVRRTVVIEAASDEEADRLLQEGKYDFSVDRVETNNTYLGYEYRSCTETDDRIITSEKDLKDYYGVDNVGHAIFKYTTCGCSYWTEDNCVCVAGYAEGSDAECPAHRLYFPFTVTQWNDAVKEADREGCDLWEENCEETEDWE